MLEDSWKNLTLINGWTNHNINTYYPLSYKILNNVIYFRGLVSGTAATLNSIFAGIPNVNSGKIVVVQLVSEQTIDNKIQPVIRPLFISSSNAYIIEPLTYKTWYSFDGVSFAL